MTALEKHYLLLEELPELQRYAVLVAVEDGFISNISDYVISKFDKMGNIFKNLTTIDSKVQNRIFNQEGLKLLKLKPKVATAIANNTYPYVKGIKIPVPLGFNTTLLNAIELLTNDLPLYTSEVYKIVDTCETLVSKFGSDDKFVSSNRPANKFKVETKQLDTLNTSLATMITTKKPKDKLPYGDLVYNLSDLDKIYTKLTALAIHKHQAKLSKVDDAITRISSAVKYIVSDMQNNPLRVIDSKRLDELGTLLEITAQYVSVSTTMMYLSAQVINTYKEIITKLNK